MNLSKLLDEVFAVQKSKLDDSARLMSFDSWDSMTHMVFITRLEEMFENGVILRRSVCGGGDEILQDISR